MAGKPENLKPWPKGKSGNPGGRPKSLSITRLVREVLQKPTVEGSSISKAEMLATVVVNMALAGDRVFAPLVWRYVDGEPKDTAEKAVRELAAKLAPKLGLDADALADEFLRDIGAA